MDDDEYRWVTQTAEGLVRDILKQMAGIEAYRMPQATDLTGLEMDAVCAHIHGDYRMEAWLRAEPESFYRLTRNISGEEPLSEASVQEYATEFFNVLCGRFISAICDRKHILMRFDPPEYKKAASGLDPAVCDRVSTLTFQTELKELFEFSWGKHMSGSTAECERSEVL